MDNVLKDLYFGEVQPNMRNYAENSILRKAEQIVDEKKEVLSELLEGKDKKLFLDLVNAQSEVDTGRPIRKILVLQGDQRFYRNFSYNFSLCNYRGMVYFKENIKSAL